MYFMMGSLILPLVGSLASTAEVASRSSSTAASVAARSPRLPVPKARYWPVLNAPATALMYRGDGLEVTKRWISVRATNGGAFWWPT